MAGNKQNESEKAPPWMGQVLKAAAVYNLLWGAVVIAAPGLFFRWIGMEPPRYPQIWQCVGMIVGVYGVGYWIAAREPIRHWPIVLVGLLGKVLGPIGFFQSAIAGDLPWSFGLMILTNDLIWWIPFVAILYRAVRQLTDPSLDGVDSLTAEEAMRTVRCHRGQTLDELSQRQPVLAVFLRHTGCTFCRETLADLATKRRYIESQGVTIAIVHMSNPLQATEFLQRYDLDDIHRFSDTNCTLYKAFGLPRGSFLQLFGRKVWSRGLVAGLFGGHGIGALTGDGFRLAGAFLLRNGKVTAARRTTSAADQLDFLDIAKLASHTVVYRSPAMPSAAF